jgi:hypothetical protein
MAAAGPGATGRRRYWLGRRDDFGYWAARLINGLLIPTVVLPGQEPRRAPDEGGEICLLRRLMLKAVRDLSITLSASRSASARIQFDTSKPVAAAASSSNRLCSWMILMRIEVCFFTRPTPLQPNFDTS